jgi:hypothetical protein
LRRRPSGRWKSGNRGFRFPLFHGPQFFCLSRFFRHLWVNRRVCGNVGISRRLRDSQGAVERVENLGLVFQAFHGTVISTDLRAHDQANLGGTGDSVLHWHNSLALAATIFLAHSVSLIAPANLSNWAKLIFGLRHCAAFGNDFSFSYGVA